MKRGLFLIALGLFFLTVVPPVQAGGQNVTVYAARLTDAEKSLFPQFQEKTEISVTVIQGKAGELLKRISEKSAATEAGLFTAVDGGVLLRAKKSGLPQPIPGEAVAGNVSALRDKDLHWAGLSARARVIVYSLERVAEKDLSTYEALPIPGGKAGWFAMGG